MGDIAESIQGNKNLIQTVSGTIASIGLEQTGKRVAGALVTPATWAMNYAAEGNKPGIVDVGIWGAGFISAPASIATGLVKAVVDDDISQRLRRVREKEPSKYSRFINDCHSYASSSPQINAMTIASKGGTAWVSSVGLWVYITDARGKLVADYLPADYTTIYQPQKPYQGKSNGSFIWHVKYKR